MSENHASLFASAVPGNGSSDTVGENENDQYQETNITQQTGNVGRYTPDESDNGQQGTNPLGMSSQEMSTTTNQARSNKNVSNKWTTSSKASGLTKSLNSKRSPVSYQSSISIRGVSKPETQLSSTTPKPLTRFKPYLLQQLGEVKFPKKHSTQRDRIQTQQNLAEIPSVTPKSTNSFHKSVMTQRDLEKNLWEVDPTTNLNSNFILHGASNKKRRVFESEMPWYTREEEARRSGNKDCEESHRILHLFARDYKVVKQWIQTSRTVPLGFPGSEWDNIIRGQAVNLDAVFSSLHHISAPKENVGRVGDTEISLGRSEPAKKVQTSGEWTSAWNATIKAIKFAFPHREQELREYAKYIEGHFSAKVVSAHQRVILYDIAIRNEVGGGQNTLLTDTHRFSRFFSAIVMPDGIESEHAQGGGRGFYIYSPKKN